MRIFWLKCYIIVGMDGVSRHPLNTSLIYVYRVKDFAREVEKSKMGLTIIISES